MKIGYFADGPWSHNAFYKIFENKGFQIKFICVRYDSSDLILKNIHSMDSLKHMELISLVEKIKKKNITAKEIKKLKQIKDVMKLLNIK